MSRTISKSGLEWIEQKLNEPMKQCWIKLRCKMFGQWTMCVFNVNKRLSELWSSNELWPTASDDCIPGILTKNETSKHCDSLRVSRLTQMEMFASLWPSRKPSKRKQVWLQNAKLEQITFWQSTTLIHRPTQMLIALLRSRKCETSWMHGLQNHFTAWNLIT